LATRWPISFGEVPAGHLLNSFCALAGSETARAAIRAKAEESLNVIEFCLFHDRCAGLLEQC
jgi:hypothetical protein